MPPHLLLPHLVRKSWRRRTEGWFDRKDDSKQANRVDGTIMQPDQ
jgi:hypothetical protein